MSPDALTGLLRYGLNRNPYLNAPLDPLTKGHKLGSTLGISQQLQEAEDYIQRAAAAGETAFVLVQGKRGTGRTTICNHLLRCHCDARGIDPAQFIVPKPRNARTGQDAIAIFRAWVVKLYGQLQAAKLTPLGKERFDLDDELPNIGRQDPATLGTRAADLLGEVTNVLELKESPAGFGACFENVKDYSLIELAFEAFAEARTLVLFVALDYPRTHQSLRVLYEAHNPDSEAVTGSHYPVLDMGAIRGDHARELVQFHWSEAAGALESPFDDNGLVQAFDDRARAAGRVVAVTSQMLELRAEMADAGPPWPEDRTLRFEPKVLEALVQRIDALLPRQFDE